MKVQKIDNSQSFGIKCIKSSAWNKEILQKLQNSKLAQEIDAKYPNASANYFFFKQNDIANDEDIWTTLFDITLKPDRIWHYRLDSHTETVPNKYLGNKLETANLKEIENEIIEQKKDGSWTTPLNDIHIKRKKTNPIKEIFNKLFHIN
jgi:hypothetical protein